MRLPTGCFVVALLAMTSALCAFGQADWVKQESGVDASLRGVHAVSEQVAWASGSGGTVLRTVNGGNKWEKCAAPKGGETLDYRGVYAWSEKEAIVMASGPAEKGQAKLFKTSDGCKTWRQVFASEMKGVFFDAIAFYPVERKHGLVLSDPVDGRFRLFETKDGGEHWAELVPQEMPPVLEGEGAFAASNSAMAVGEFLPGPCFGTGGGGKARIFCSSDGGSHWTVTATPIDANAASKGIFSVAIETSDMYAAGGDYANPDSTTINVVHGRNGGKVWEAVSNGGYRSAVCGEGFAIGPASTAFAGLNAMTCGELGWAVGQKGLIVRIRK